MTDVKLREGFWQVDNGDVVWLRRPIGWQNGQRLKLSREWRSQDPTASEKTMAWDDEGYLLDWGSSKRLGPRLLYEVVFAREDPDQYQTFCLTTVASGVDVEMMGCIGLFGELGEMMEPIKKHRFHGRSLDLGALEKEFGDAFWYFTVLANHFGFRLSNIMRKNREKLTAGQASWQKKVQEEARAVAEAWAEDSMAVRKKLQEEANQKEFEAAALDELVYGASFLQVGSDGSVKRISPPDAEEIPNAGLADPRVPGGTAPRGPEDTRPVPVVHPNPSAGSDDAVNPEGTPEPEGRVDGGDGNGQDGEDGGEAPPRADDDGVGDGDDI